MTVGKRIERIKEALPQDVTLVAVSKFHPSEVIMEAYNAGQRVFGESRAQELCQKQKALPQDIDWHFIGTLQRNKVKDIIPYVHTIQSIDSIRLLDEVNRQAAKHGRVVNILLEVHIAAEESKHGFTPEQCREVLNANPSGLYPNVNIVGLMGMATFTDDTSLVRQEFARLRSLKDEYPHLKTLSIGMSDDYKIAIEEGSNMVRIGSSLFGNRE